MKAIQSVSHPWAFDFFKGGQRSHIGSTRNCGVVLKFERLSHLSNRSFGLDSSIRLEYLLIYMSKKTRAIVLGRRIHKHMEV